VRLYRLKRLFVGTPLPTAQARHERLSKRTGLAIFASDNLSSVAYATEEIMRVLILAGVAALSLSTPISIAIGAVICIVIYSYRQTIVAYPQGASDYIVAKDNLGTAAGLVAGSALLIDYTLTVAVSAVVAAAIVGFGSAPRAVTAGPSVSPVIEYVADNFGCVGGTSAHGLGYPVDHAKMLPAPEAGPSMRIETAPVAIRSLTAGSCAAGRDIWIHSPGRRSAFASVGGSAKSTRAFAIAA